MKAGHGQQADSPTDDGITVESVSRTICTVCLQSLPVTKFYRKRDGLESCCKTCKKNARRSRYTQIHDLETSSTNTDNSPEEPQSTIQREPERPYIEPQQGDDFWCRKYGRELSEEDKRDIRYNLSELLAVLDEVRKEAK